MQLRREGESAQDDVVNWLFEWSLKWHIFLHREWEEIENNCTRVAQNSDLWRKRTISDIDSRGFPKILVESRDWRDKASEEIKGGEHKRTLLPLGDSLSVGSTWQSESGNHDNSNNWKGELDNSRRILLYNIEGFLNALIGFWGRGLTRCNVWDDVF